MICRDKDILQRILSDDSVFYSAKDDCNVDKSKLGEMVANDKRMIPVVPHEDVLFLFIPMNQIMCEIHVAVILQERVNALKHARVVEEWFFNTTQYTKLVGFIPEFDQKTRMFAVMFGMKREGKLTESYLKNGVLHNMLIYGTRRTLCHQ